MTLIEITQNDIDKGEPNNAMACAITRGLNRQFGETCFAGYLGITIGGMDARDTYEPSHEICQFMKAFDAGIPVDPFSFDLDALVKLD